MSITSHLACNASPSHQTLFPPTSNLTPPGSPFLIAAERILAKPVCTACPVTGAMRFPDEEFDLDRDFPLGDGPADTDATVQCPYCSEQVEITLDPGGGSSQQYVEDCAVCCNPWRVSVTYHDGAAEVSVSALDE